jgi:hypothetical protein
MFHPTIEFLFQISTKNHPQAEASNTQERVVSHYPFIAQKSHNPLIFSYNYPDFPSALFLSTCPTQGIYPFIDRSPLGVPFIYQGLSDTNNQ